MAVHGYLVFLLRASVPHRERQLMRLSALASEGQPDLDLLTLMNEEIERIGSTYYTDALSADGYRVRGVRLAGRTLWLRVNKGPEGSPGEAYNRVDDTFVDTTQDTSLLSGLRAMFFVPADSYYGLLFVERLGRRNLKDLIQRLVVRPAGASARAIVRVESYAEADDWRRELRGQQALRVSEILHSTDGSDDASTVDDTVVQVTTEGGVVARASEAIKGLVVDRIEAHRRRLELLQQMAPYEAARGGKGLGKGKLPRGSFTVQAEQEYQQLLTEYESHHDQSNAELTDLLEGVAPIDREHYTRKRFEVGMGVERTKRTFVVESDAVPQFVYETQSILSSVMLEGTWRRHAESIFKNLGLSLPPGWMGQELTEDEA